MGVSIMAGHCPMSNTKPVPTLEHHVTRYPTIYTARHIAVRSPTDVPGGGTNVQTTRPVHPPSVDSLPTLNLTMCTPSAAALSATIKGIDDLPAPIPDSESSLSSCMNPGPSDSGSSLSSCMNPGPALEQTSPHDSPPPTILSYHSP